MGYPLSIKKNSIAIVDYGMGNLFSVQRACEAAGIEVNITNNIKVLREARALILPGVGAFGDAMHFLKTRDLVPFIREWAFQGKPLIGICLGMQLFLEKSCEFGLHEGLGIVEGDVVRFEYPVAGNYAGQGKSRRLKVPQVGWNRIDLIQSRHNPSGMIHGDSMYFVHSFYVKPKNENIVVAVSRYGGIEFCSAFQKNNIIAFQFHPEQSGTAGLRLYKNLASWIQKI